MLTQKNFDAFDKIIFFDKFSAPIESMQIPEALTTLIKSNNEKFVEHLFFHATTKKELEFWFNNSACLPKNPIGLALSLRCKKFVFEYLFDQKCFDPIFSNMNFHNGFFFHRSGFMNHVADLDEKASSYIKSILPFGKKLDSIKYGSEQTFKNNLFRLINDKNLYFTDCVITMRL